MVSCSYCFYLQQQVRAEDEEGQPNTEDAHTTEKQKQSPSPPNRRAAPSSLQRPLLLRGELHPPSWRICWGIPSLPQLSSPSLPMLKLRRRLSSSVVLHQFLSLWTFSWWGKNEVMYPCFPSWASNTPVFRLPVSLQKESPLLQGIL